MTRDAERAQCIDAMAKAICKSQGRDPDELIEFGTEPYSPLWGNYTLEATSAFDALHGLARVCSVEATEEMLIAGSLQSTLPGIWHAMTTSGALTNEPETKL